MENAQRLRKKQREGKTVRIRYFGDSNPYGEIIELETWNKIWLEPYSLGEY